MIDYNAILFETPKQRIASEKRVKKIVSLFQDGVSAYMRKCLIKAYKSDKNTKFKYIERRLATTTNNETHPV